MSSRLGGDGAIDQILPPAVGVAISLVTAQPSAQRKAVPGADGMPAAIAQQNLAALSALLVYA